MFGIDDALIFGAGTALFTNIWNSAEAAKNRRFQERMSSSAHTREVADLQRAGINPMMSRMGSGASSPGGDRAVMEDVGKGAASAAQVSLMRKQGALLDAQTQGENARTQGQQISNQTAWSGQAFQLDKLKHESQVAGLSVKEREAALPFVVRELEARIDQMSSASEANRARAVLDQLRKEGFENDAEFERRLGEVSPAIRSALQILRTLLRPR